MDLPDGALNLDFAASFGFRVCVLADGVTHNHRSGDRIHEGQSTQLKRAFVAMLDHIATASTQQGRPGEWKMPCIGAIFN